MDYEVEKKRIQESHINGKIKLVFNLTGGGCTFLSKLLSVSGASNTVLHASIPYSKTSLQLLLDNDDLLENNRYVSKEVAVALCKQAFGMAEKIISQEYNGAIGFGGFACTAELKTSDECSHANVVVSIMTSAEADEIITFVWRKGKLQIQKTHNRLMDGLISYPDICGTRQEQESILSNILLFLWIMIQH
jgi:hypothetical protein